MRLLKIQLARLEHKDAAAHRRNTQELLVEWTALDSFPDLVSRIKGLHTPPPYVARRHESNVKIPVTSLRVSEERKPVQIHNGLSHPPGIIGEQRLQRFKVVALNEHVGRFGFTGTVRVISFEQAIRKRLGGFYVFIVVRKNSTTLMQHGPIGCTRGEVRSGWGAPQLGLIGRNDASAVVHVRANLGAGRAGQAPKKSVVGPDCNAVAKTTEFLEDARRLRG